QVDAGRTALRAAEAQLAAARARGGIAETGVASAVVSRGSLEAAVESARAQVHLAEIDLQNTRIVAPRDGQLGEVTARVGQQVAVGTQLMRSEEHTSELQSRENLVCRLLLEKKERLTFRVAG